MSLWPDRFKFERELLSPSTVVKEWFEGEDDYNLGEEMDYP